jgi:erythromycin esterase-like protein
MIDDSLDVLRQHASWFEPAMDGFGRLFEAIGDAEVVLIGEASHGTHEFYQARAELTKALVARAGFNIVAVEADWPDAYRANRWVRHRSDDADPEAALGDFLRFPRWMWRNTDVVGFLAWLREFNGAQPLAGHAGFYGLDLYSLHASADAVLAYLATVDPEAATRARFRSKTSARTRRRMAMRRRSACRRHANAK